MNRHLSVISVLLILISMTGCNPGPDACETYTGYGRYTIHVDCENVVIDGQTYNLARYNGEFQIAGHTIFRGIYRKDRPWLYVHQINADSIDVTFEEGAKPEYPLSTGIFGSIGDVYAPTPWEMTRSTNAEFTEGYWLISHRWADTGIFFDLQKQTGDVNDWILVQADIFVPGDGTEVAIEPINTNVKITAFNAAETTANVLFAPP